MQKLASLQYKLIKKREMESESLHIFIYIVRKLCSWFQTAGYPLLIQIILDWNFTIFGIIITSSITKYLDLFGALLSTYTKVGNTKISAIQLRMAMLKF